jgi:putative IMPACT (imprinted ancient) family translation regulator
MKSSFKTIRAPASGTLVERKSEFIGYVSPVKTEEEAIAFVNEIRKKHSDARHNVYAYILRENNTVRFSDDGEPHGTAGMPVLDVLRREELTDIAVVVTRISAAFCLEPAVWCAPIQRRQRRLWKTRRLWFLRILLLFR